MVLRENMSVHALIVGSSNSGINLLEIIVVTSFVIYMKNDYLEQLLTTCSFCFVF
jgi:hypothetical protein